MLPGISRSRAFRRAVLLLAVSVGVALTAQDPASGERVSERVLVIGAGMAGLAAADALAGAGYEVVVLEARDRIGGRVWTDETDFEPVDLGASWIHGGGGNPLHRLAQELGARQAITRWGNSAEYDADGSPASLTRSEYRRWTRTLRRGLRRARRLTPDATVQEVVTALRDRGALDFLTDREVDFLLNTEIEHEFAADAAELSVLGQDEGLAFGGPDRLLLDGYGALPASLAEGLDVRLEHEVTAVDWSGALVRVETTAGLLEANRVVVTLPLGVLQRGTVDFEPALPAAKVAAIERLAMGVLNKVWLRFPGIFWDQDAHVLGYASEPKGHFTEWINLARHGGGPALLAFNAGAWGRESEELSDAELVERAMVVLRTVYGADIPDPIDARVTRWDNDPFAAGSYSYLPPGARPSDRAALAAPVGDRLFFAGEATSVDYPATVHGAYLSGLRAADEIMALR